MTGRRKKSGASAFDWLRVVHCHCNICIKGHTYVTNLHLYGSLDRDAFTPRVCRLHVRFADDARDGDEPITGLAPHDRMMRLADRTACARAGTATACVA